MLHLAASNPWSIAISAPRMVELDIGTENRSIHAISEASAVQLFRQEASEREMPDDADEYPAWMSVPELSHSSSLLVAAQPSSPMEDERGVGIGL